MDERAFQSLTKFLEKVPAINTPIATGVGGDGLWWVKFQIDIASEYAWKVVQELGHVINYLSVDERLPALFYPVSPPPYLNGGPDEYLSWVIEARDKAFSPGTLKKWLEERLPKPVDDLDEWDLEE